VEWTPIANPDILDPWMTESNAYLEGVDPYHHLTTHSGSQMGDEIVWDNVDIVHEHMYNMRNVTLDFSLQIPDWLEKYPNQPFIIGEFGSPSEYDVNGLMDHLGLWAAPMLGSLGTGMPWFWEDFHAADLYYHIAGLSAYYAGEDMGAHQWQPTAATLDEETDARILGLQDDTTMRLWIVSKNYSDSQLIRFYEQNIRDGAENPLDIVFPEVTGTTLTLRGLADGNYTVEWWDTIAGTVSSTEAVTISNGEAVVNVPTFATDWAVKVQPE
jgi:hypothetical protein